MLKIKNVSLDTHPENTVFLSRRCTAYRAEEFTALKKVEVSANGKTILATLMVCDDPLIVAPDELGVGDPAFRRMGATTGALATLAQAAPPRSLDAVRKKINGLEMSAPEVESVIRDISAFRYSPMEIAAFLVSTAGFMTTDEVLALTEAMINVGAQLTWDAPLIVDKHCIGGIPGNRTSMIVAPIVAAHGLKMPKTSSRAITSPAGTADTMEVLARVDLTTDEMRTVIETHNACLAWGGHANLSPADDVLISVERPLRIDTQEQLVASILSKKRAAGSTHLLIDIPVGPSAKIRSTAEGVRLRKLFEFVGAKIGLHLTVVFTDGSQPVGNGVGPVLEARDVMAVLRNEASAPGDLRARALFLAGKVLDFDPDLHGAQGRARAEELLDSGAALAKMEEIIAAQGPTPSLCALGEITEEVKAGRDGVVTAMDCFRLGRIARLAGAPLDKGAGIDHFKKIGEPVVKGEPLYRIHSCFQSDFEFASAMAAENCGVAIGAVPDEEGRDQ
ncbi:MAG: thymidine phosphorylase family protein [Pseudomonadota bacterium]